MPPFKKGLGYIKRLLHTTLKGRVKRHSKGGYATVTVILPIDQAKTLDRAMMDSFKALKAERAIQIIAITGPAASGKTGVGQYLRGLNHYVIETDSITRGNIPDEIQENLIKEIGNDVINEKGGINRSIIFQSKERMDAHYRVIAPFMRNRIFEMIKEHTFDKHRTVFIDSAYVHKLGLEEVIDKVWFIQRNDDQRRGGIIERDKAKGLNEEDSDRAFNQLKELLPSQKEYADQSDLIFENNGTLDDLFKKVDEAMNQLDIQATETPDRAMMAPISHRSLKDFIKNNNFINGEELTISKYSLGSLAHILMNWHFSSKQPLVISDHTILLVLSLLVLGAWAFQINNLFNTYAVDMGLFIWITLILSHLLIGALFFILAKDHSKELKDIYIVKRFNNLYKKISLKNELFIDRDVLTQVQKFEKASGLSVYWTDHPYLLAYPLLNEGRMILNVGFLIKSDIRKDKRRLAYLIHLLRRVGKLVGKDLAMMNSVNKGGIDLNNLNMKTSGEVNALNIPAGDSPQKTGTAPVSQPIFGLTPKILHIGPVNAYQFLGLKNPDEADPKGRADSQMPDLIPELSFYRKD